MSYMSRVVPHLFIVFLSLSANERLQGQTETSRTIPVLRGEIRDFAASPGEVYRVEMIRGAAYGFDSRAHVDPTGSFEFRNVQADSYRFRVLNVQNEVIAEQWVTLSQHDASVTLSLPHRNGSRPVSGVVSAKGLGFQPPKAARKAFAKSVKAAESTDYAGAAAYLEEAVRISPNYFQARSNLGVQYLRLNRTAEALEQLAKALELGGEDGVVYANLAFAQLILNQVEEAGVSARRAISLAPDRPAGHFLLASVLLRQPGNRQEAIRHLQASADEIPQARWLLARVYAEQRQVADATQEISRYLTDGHAEHRLEAQRLLNLLKSLH